MDITIQIPNFIKKDNLFAEKLLLLKLSKFILNQKDIEEINSIASSVKNWDAASHMAKINGISAIILKNIENYSLKKISPSFKKNLHQEALQIKYRNAIKLMIMNDLIELFEKEGIHFLIIKGYQFIKRYYSDSYIRDIGDIDFLIPKEYYEKAISIMNNNRYKLEDILYGHHKMYYSDKFKVAIELHSDLISKPHYFNYDLEEFINNAIFFKDKEISGFVLKDNYELYLQLISSLYSHSFLPFRARILTDIQAIMLSIYENINWQEVESKTKQIGCFNYLLLAWKICNYFYDLTPPENLKNYLDTKSFNRKYPVFLYYLFHYLEYLIDAKHRQNLLPLQLIFADNFKNSFFLFYNYIILPRDYVRVAKIHLKIPIPFYLFLRIITLPFKFIYKTFYIYIKSKIQ